MGRLESGLTLFRGLSRRTLPRPVRKSTRCKGSFTLHRKRCLAQCNATHTATHAVSISRRSEPLARCRVVPPGTALHGTATQRIRCERTLSDSLNMETKSRICMRVFTSASHEAQRSASAGGLLLTIKIKIKNENTLREHKPPPNTA